jgi:hypothetical protein
MASKYFFLLVYVKLVLGTYLCICKLYIDVNVYVVSVILTSGYKSTIQNNLLLFNTS